jgi:ankyrin repeat protein
LDPREYKDHRGNSIIHHLCYQSFADLLKIYVNHTARLLDEQIRSSRVLYPKSVKQEIGVWLNEKNPEGWTPILYASYLGNI